MIGRKLNLLVLGIGTLTYATTANAEEQSWGVGHSGVVCGIVDNWQGLQCATDDGLADPAAIDGANDGVLISGVINADESFPSAWNDGDNAIYTLKRWHNGFDDLQSFCGLDAGFDFFWARIGDDCSQPTYMITWGNSGNGKKLAQGSGTGSKKSPGLVVDANDNPKMFRAASSAHQNTVAVDECYIAGGFGKQCGPNNRDCGGFTAGKYWAEADDLSYLYNHALEFETCIPDAVDISHSGDVSILTLDEEDHYPTGSGNEDRFESLFSSNVGGDFPSYALTGIFWEDGTPFTDKIDHFHGSDGHWCAVTKDGAGLQGGDDQGGLDDDADGYMDHHTSDWDADGGDITGNGDGSDGGALTEVFPDDVIDCAVAAQITCYVDNQGSLDCAGRNENYKFTDAYTLDSASYTGRNIAAPSGMIWVDVDGMGESICAQAVTSLAVATGPVYCWAGEYANWGTTPTLYLSDVMVSYSP